MGRCFTRNQWLRPTQTEKIQAAFPQAGQASFDALDSRHEFQQHHSRYCAGVCDRDLRVVVFLSSFFARSAAGTAAAQKPFANRQQGKTPDGFVERENEEGLNG